MILFLELSLWALACCLPIAYSWGYKRGYHAGYNEGVHLNNYNDNS